MSRKNQRQTPILETTELLETQLPPTRENNSHDQLVEKALENPGVKAAYDELEEEFTELEKNLKKQMEIEAAAPSIPKKIQMLKNFRIEIPLAGRSDVSMGLSLKKDQEITDKRIIKHLLNSDALFIAK
jgi:hypothetical protein